MGIFGKIIQGVADIATMPIDVVKDVIGLSAVYKDEPYTLKKAKKLKTKTEEIYDALDED
jgi:hypothetical protein